MATMGRDVPAFNPEDGGGFSHAAELTPGRFAPPSEPNGTIIARLATSMELANETAPMEPSEIYAKTDLGLRELKERRLNLPIAMRGLLILIDGNRTVAQVLVKARALKLDLQSLAALERDGLIVKRFSSPSTGPDNAPIRQGARSEDEVERYLQAQQMISDAINAHLGFRGYGLMMRLQKTANVRDLHDLLPDFAKALVKRLGIEPATPIVSSIERLISGT